ncbi:bZIP transcription factor 17 [Glycine soja]
MSFLVGLMAPSASVVGVDGCFLNSRWFWVSKSLMAPSVVVIVHLDFEIWNTIFHFASVLKIRRSRGQHPHVHRVSPEQRKALGSGSTKALKDHMKSSATDDKMQQWFREGLAGDYPYILAFLLSFTLYRPMFSSGICTEVFQFNVSPSPGAIVPATSVANVSTENCQNVTSVKKTGNRRTLHELPEPLNGSSLNITKEQVKNLQKDHLHGNKSSMVVSVFVDPREAGDGDVDVDGMMRPRMKAQFVISSSVGSIIIFP